MDSSKDKIAKELHDVLDQGDMYHIEFQFQQRQRVCPGVTCDEFEDIIFGLLPRPSPISYDQLRSVFMIIDVSDSGYIDWNGFLSFILTALQRDEAASQTIETSLNQASRTIKGPNRDVLTGIELMPFLLNDGDINYSSYRYVTVSRDGVLAVWTPMWKLQKFRFCTSQPKKRIKMHPWVLSMVCFPNVQLIAVSSTDETIQLYDIINTNMDLIYVITKIEAIVTCLDYWCDENDLERSVLVFGDTLGRIVFIYFEQAVSMRLFGSVSGYDQKIVLNDVYKNQYKYVTSIEFERVHDEWVKQVKYIPKLKSILSCAVSSNKSMALCGTFLDLEPKLFATPKGISSFDFSSDENIIVTGSIDRCVRLWNPYINSKSVATLRGHSSPIAFVIIIHEKFQAISIAEDKRIKVWDLRDRICIQTLNDRILEIIKHPLTAAKHDPIRRLLLLGSMRLIIVERVWQTESDNAVFISHTKSIVGVVYSKVYNYVISCSENSSIIYWDLETGLKKIQVNLTHSTQLDGEEVAEIITAVTLDDDSRRLITAGSDRQLKMWALSNGSLIAKFEIPGGKDVFAIVATKKRIYFGSRVIYVLNDELHRETLRTWALHHTDDIMALDWLEPNQIASAAWDEKIIIWQADTGQQMSIFSLQHEYIFNYFPVLRSLARKQIVGCHARSIAEMASALAIKHSSSGRSRSSFTKSGRWRSSASTKRTSRTRTRSSSSSVTGRTSMKGMEAVEVTFPALYCMVTLRTRPDKPSVGNIFAADVDGFIQFWSSSRTGGLLAMFSAVTFPDHYITCMTTDTANKYLFTGDTFGFIRVWYIRFFMSAEVQVEGDKQIQLDKEPFPFSMRRYFPVAARVVKELEEIKPNDHLHFLRYERPPILNSFQGHVKTIVQITVPENNKVIITASKDKSVRLWSFSGAYFKTLGDRKYWSFQTALISEVQPMDRKVPADITKVASGPTLQVILQGLGPRWFRLRELFLNTYAKSITRKRQDSLLSRQLSVEGIQESAEHRKLSHVQRMKAQEYAYSQMGSPIGEYYSFKEKREIKSLPSKMRAFTDMVAAYAFLEPKPLQPINLEHCYKYLDSHRLAARLKSS